MTREWESALHRGDVGALRRLLDEGAEVDGLDRHGQTSLMIAARDGLVDVVRLLIERRADLDRTAKFRLTALMLAVMNGHESVAAMLIGAGADLTLTGSGAPGFAGKTARDLAEAAGHTAIAMLFDR
jgi:ankyrin repeat protein